MTQVVTVVDNAAPVITCVDTVRLVLDASGAVTLSETDVLITATENCTIVDSSFAAATKLLYSCADIDTTAGLQTPVVLSVADVSGKIGSCTSALLVLDQTAPVARCKTTTVVLAIG